MHISIGVRDIARELSLDVALSEDELFDAVNAALSQGTPLTLDDTKGQRVLVPASSIGFVSVAPEEQRRVGFALN